MRRLALIFGLAGAISIAALPSFAQNETDKLETAQAHSVGRIVADLTGLKPGGKILVGVHITLEPEWHTYWKNPGDSASTAIFDFRLPEGYTNTPLKFGIPQRIPVGPLMSFGYEGETVIYSEISVPESETSTPGEQRTLGISAEWVVCKEECLPAFFDFTLTLPIQANPKASPAAVKFENTARGMTPEQWLDGELLPREGSNIIVHIPVNSQLGVLQDLIPYPKQMVTNSDIKLIQVNANTMSATFTYERRDGVNERQLDLLAIYKSTENSSKRAVSLRATPAAQGLWGMLLFAFLGGLILNLMPCVFPVLALKLFSFVKVGPDDRPHLIMSNLVYLLGVLVSFWVLAGAIIALRTSGGAFGWGFQMQSPTFVTAMVLLFFIVGLNFIGLFEFSGRFAGVGHKLTTQGGHSGSFFTGVLAVIVASPCTAPFMGAAMGYALSQSAWVTMLVFSALGLGLAFPYVFFGFFPGLSKILPKPGTWMVRLKELMAFPMWATCIWLLYVLQQLVGSIAQATVLIICLVIGAAFWGLQKFSGRGLAAFLVACAAVAITPLVLFGNPLQEQASTSQTSQDSFWVPFDETELTKLVQQQQAVFINFTAAWCISCQVNDKTTFQNTQVRSFIRDRGIVMMKGDWTNRNETIGNYLARYGRAGVPLYLYFPPGQEQAQVLPEILTPGDFMNRLQSQISANQKVGG